jgi:UDP-N-acetyl-2-amino-2-deoxyglucuronate dehydrogenase
MKYAIIGSGGFIAPRHFQAIKDTGGEVALTCDINPDNNADFTNYRDMLASDRMKDVDTIVICTPNHLHAEMVRDSLRTGKKVLCEKPLTINTDFSGLEGVNTVQQLHFHPLFNEICQKLKNAKKIKAVLRAYRDEEFWASWKGDESKSGGVVFILGAHIWDLLISALGDDFKIITVDDNMRRSNGMVEIGGKNIEYSFEFLLSREGQTRHLEIDDEKYILSLKDNLSFEGLHDKVYSAFLEDRATKLIDVAPSINLMDQIKKWGRN